MSEEFGEPHNGECKKCGPVVTYDGRCPGCGIFVKGGKVNRSKSLGRPKKPKPVGITDKERELYKDDPKKALLWLLNTASTREELFRTAKTIIDYCAPKLSAVKQEVREDKTINVVWQGFSEVNVDVIDVKEENQKTFTQQNILDVDVPQLVEEMSKSEVKEVLKQLDSKEG